MIFSHIWAVLANLARILTVIVVLAIVSDKVMYTDSYITGLVALYFAHSAIKEPLYQKVLSAEIIIRAIFSTLIFLVCAVVFLVNMT
jgi:uncharacterized membrane protein